MQWDDFPIAGDAAASSGNGETVELTENGYGALVAWEAGPRHVRRWPRDNSARTIRVTVEARGRPAVSWDEPMTAEELDGIASDINDYLADAGIPPQPPGYQWVLHLPPGSARAQDFWGLVNRHVALEDGLQPRDTRRAVAAALRRIGIDPEL